MLDHNYAGAHPDDYWEELTATAAEELPSTPSGEFSDYDWQKLGIYAWNYSAVRGRFGDETEELEAADAEVERLEEFLEDASSRELRLYIEGLMFGIRDFMGFGL